MRTVLFSLLIICTTCFTHAQDTLAWRSRSLDSVTVQAFQSRMRWKDAPAALALITEKELNRYAPVSLVPAMNLVPGVRMEERSPASYRLSFRGSLLRSPFGVRNVKVYWNDIPLTDGGGNTYLNLVDISQLSGAEIIKGPAASMYGAGTGGALLLKSAIPTGNSFDAASGGGSFGLFQESTGWHYGGKEFSSAIRQVHQQSDGYRQQSGSRKDAINWQGKWNGKTQQLQFLFFYTDLYYQTPGGITLAQMQTDPKLARQPAGAIPGSVQQKAAVYNKTIFGGVHYNIDLGKYCSLQSFITANHTSFTNPFITNYEKRNERNLGAGVKLVFQKDNWQWITGAEWLYNHSGIDDYGNRGGNQDTVQFKDDIYASQRFAFSQLQIQAGKRWLFTAGLSINNQAYRFRRLTDAAPDYIRRTISAVITPRFAVLYHLSGNISLYALAAKGFSPPAIAEVRPSDGNFYGDLNAEYGWNFEGGIKGESSDKRLQFDIAYYHFSLQNAIVRRNNSAGAEYFVNAGSTTQQGIELMGRYRFIKQQHAFITGAELWSSFSFQPYRFDSYVQGSLNYSGNRLTGVPRTVWVSGFDLEMHHWYLNTSINATSSLPLTDANDVYADGYQLLQCKAGYRQRKWEVYLGIDNLLNQLYSLGNDINAAGKRYYNPAAGRNVFGGVAVRF